MTTPSPGTTTLYEDDHVEIILYAWRDDPPEIWIESIPDGEATTMPVSTFLRVMPEILELLPRILEAQHRESSPTDPDSPRA